MSDKSPIARALAELTTERENLAARLAKVDAAIDTLRDLFHLKAERPAPKPRATAAAPSTNGKHGDVEKAIRAALAGGPMRPGELATELGIERANLRHTLLQLETAGVVVSTGVTAGRRVALAGRAAEEAP